MFYVDETRLGITTFEGTNTLSLPGSSNNFNANLLIDLSSISRACVGIKVEPKGDEDWFCRACISRKQSDQTDGKKKKRKKKDKDKRDH